MNTAILTISCPDQRGITAAVTNFIFQHNGNILHADQHIDEQTNTFFMRVEWSLAGFELKGGEIAAAFSSWAKHFGMRWNLYLGGHVPMVAIFVSRRLHCLHDLLFRFQTGQFKAQVALIVSNHPDARAVAEKFNIKFLEYAILRENKRQQERLQVHALKEHGVELIILARYMQVLTRSFVEEFPQKIINIHHSFLPAFRGQNPYAQAYQRGVKIIGATSHYVTEDLDEGPILEQDIMRVSHRDSLEDLRRKGEDLEKVVLSRAVLWHLEHKILVYNNKTVIFD